MIWKGMASPMGERTKWFDSLRDAVMYCIRNYSGGRYVFRGQREDWPLRSTLFRIAENERENRWRETAKFCKWMLNNQYLRPYHKPEEQLIAIAQHYGYPTDLLDFTKDPCVAGFFASSGNIDLTKPGVILVADIDVFKRLCQSYKIPGLSFMEIKGLWRLENQEGVFLRDYHDFMRQIDNMGYLDLFLEKILFRQTEGARISDFMPKITERYIYPEPNDLEREIERYEDLRIRSRPMNLDSSSVIVIERDPLGMDVEKLLPRMPWNEEENAAGWSTISQIKYEDYPRQDSKESIDIHFDDISAGLANTDAVNKHIPVVTEFRKRQEQKTKLPKVNPILNESIIRLFDNVQEIRFSSKKESEAFRRSSMSKMPSLADCAKAYFLDILVTNIQELLIVATFLPYTKAQVARSIQTSFSLCINSAIHSLTRNESLETSSWVFGNELIQLEYQDEAGIVSNCWAPSGYFNSFVYLIRARQRFNQVHPEYALEENSQLFQFVYEIRKIMSLKEAVDLWTDIVVPSDIFFRPRSSRILNPYYAKKIGYA